MALDPGPDVDDATALPAAAVPASAGDHLVSAVPGVPAGDEHAIGVSRPPGALSASATPRGAVVALGQLLEPSAPRPSRRGPAGPIGSLRAPSAVLSLPADTTAPADPSAPAPVPSPVAKGPPLSGPAGQILQIVDVGPSVRIFKVGRPAGLTFTGGQYLKAGIDAGRTASFSLSSAPHETHLELCIELIPGGRLTPQLFALRPGGQLAVGGQAKGSFVLDTSGHTHLMVATVTGIAPLRSMLRQALHEGTNDRFVVLHGASYADELPYHDELVALAATDPRVDYVPTVSRPAEARNAGWTGSTGRVDPLASNVAVTLDRGDLRAYACGNPGMISTVTSDLEGLGIKVRSEAFD